MDKPTPTNRTANLLVALTLAAASSSFSAYAVEPDNSAVNKRDTKSKSVTPMDQAKGSDLDVEVTRAIRAELTKDESLSVNGHNVKIITLEGIVTLRGPVDSVNEKSRIESLAKAQAHNYKIRNELQVKQ